MNAVTPLGQPAADIRTFTIAAGQTLSAPVDCAPGGNLMRIYMPENGWDGELLTFQVSPDGVAFYDLFTADNREVSYNITAGTMVFFTPPYLISANNWLKLRSGSRLNPRAQTADRVFRLSFV